MKSYKIKKSEFRDLTKLMKRVGAVSGQNSFPSCLYVGPKTYEMARKELTKVAKKEWPTDTSHRMRNRIGMYLLNYGPVVVKGIETGYVLVDTNRLGDSIARSAVHGDE